jgi:hypothetical protein
LALLDLAGGESVAGVAGRYRVSRETVYQRAARLGTAAWPGDRLRDAPRSGRPARVGAATDSYITLVRVSRYPIETLTVMAPKVL